MIKKLSNRITKTVIAAAKAAKKEHFLCELCVLCGERLPGKEG